VKVLYFGTYDQSYLHNQLMIHGLRSVGVQVTECHVQLWHDTNDKVNAAQKINWVSLGVRVFKSYLELLRVYLPLHRKYDLMMLGYTGQLDVFPARVLCWLSGRPLVLDVLMSLYLIATERQLPARNVLRWIEFLAYRTPDLLLLDTPEQAEWFEQTYRIPRSKFHLVPLGADERIFKPLPPRQADGKFRALYYGTFIPLHGVDCIIHAAHLLQDKEQFEFLLIGQGPERAKAEALTSQLGLKNVIFRDWVPLKDLPKFVAQCDILLGVFGTTEQSQRTIPNKIYQGLAMAKPVITSDGPAVRSALTHRVHAYLVERGSPDVLANAIVSLESDSVLCNQMAQSGYHLFQSQYTVEAIGKQTRNHIEEMLAKIH
jgi:glycosyltransferase involved in cell wall biosynthesis